MNPTLRAISRGAGPGAWLAAPLCALALLAGCGAPDGEPPATRTVQRDPAVLSQLKADALTESQLIPDGVIDAASAQATLAAQFDGQLDIFAAGAEAQLANAAVAQDGSQTVTLADWVDCATQQVLSSVPVSGTDYLARSGTVGIRLPASNTLAIAVTDLDIVFHGCDWAGAPTPTVYWGSVRFNLALTLTATSDGGQPPIRVATDVDKYVDGGLVAQVDGGTIYALTLRDRWRIADDVELGGFTSVDALSVPVYYYALNRTVELALEQITCSGSQVAPGPFDPSETPPPLLQIVCTAP